MKYYKIIVDKTFIGVIYSGQFVRENPRNHLLFYSDNLKGHFVDYKGILYRDYWMQPIETTNYDYIIASITEITKEEYNNLQEAISNNEQIEEEIEEEETAPTIIPDEPDVTIEFAREAKLQEMSLACRRTIENGFDLELRNQVFHFSLDTQDQLNLMSLGIMAQTQTLIPYHADGEECIFYTSEEMNEIIETANAFKIYQTTYYNALKTYIKSLERLEEITAIEYGMDIPKKYKSEVLKMLENDE